VFSLSLSLSFVTYSSPAGDGEVTFPRLISLVPLSLVSAYRCTVFTAPVFSDAAVVLLGDNGTRAAGRTKAEPRFLSGYNVIGI
jgi:hypothetical protein